jgi:hypothetical protein
MCRGEASALVIQSKGEATALVIQAVSRPHLADASPQRAARLEQVMAEEIKALYKLSSQQLE